MARNLPLLIRKKFCDSGNPENFRENTIFGYEPKHLIAFLDFHSLWGLTRSELMSQQFIWILFSVPSAKWYIYVIE